jgi:hypothetical protein
LAGVVNNILTPIPSLTPLFFSSSHPVLLPSTTYPLYPTSTTMSNPGQGFEYPRTDVSWLQRDVLLFANSIGATAADELHLLYVSDYTTGQYPL